LENTRFNERKRRRIPERLAVAAGRDRLIQTRTANKAITLTRVSRAVLERQLLNSMR
jgi:hypothetical protein